MGRVAGRADRSVGPWRRILRRVRGSSGSSSIRFKARRSVRICGSRRRGRSFRDGSTVRGRAWEAVFEEHCADCHGTYGADGRVVDYDESIVPIEDLGTDPARLQAATGDFEAVANDPKLTRGYTRFRRSSGYVPPILTNV